MIGYKGFDKNFQCLDFQYEVGKTYHLDGYLKICECGFHFCKNPLAVFNYYPPINGNRYALVEVTGKTVDDDDKSCTDELTIVRELTIAELINAVCKVEKSTGTNDYSVATNTGFRSAATNTGNQSAATNTGDQSAATNSGFRSAATNTGKFSAATNTGNFSAATNTGFRSAATNTGNYSAATNTGDQSAATNTGFRSVAIVTGKKSVAIATGRDSCAKGALGCWIVISDWRGGEIFDVQAFKVDGKTIKADTFYLLQDGKPIEVEEAQS